MVDVRTLIAALIVLTATANAEASTRASNIADAFLALCASENAQEAALDGAVRRGLAQVERSVTYVGHLATIRRVTWRGTALRLNWPGTGPEVRDRSRCSVDFELGLRDGIAARLAERLSAAARHVDDDKVWGISRNGHDFEIVLSPGPRGSGGERVERDYLIFRQARR